MKYYAYFPKMRYKDYYHPQLDSYKSPNNYDEIELHLNELLEDKTNPPKPFNETIRTLGYDPNTILRRFPDLAKKLSIKYQNHLAETRTYKSKKVDLNLTQLKNALCELLNATKPISMSEACEQLGYDQVIINTLLPEEYKQITDRSKNYRRQQILNKKEQLREKIISVIYEVHNRGQYPSINVVREVLLMPNLFRGQDTKKIWRDTIHKLGYKEYT